MKTQVIRSIDQLTQKTTDTHSNLVRLSTERAHLHFDLSDNGRLAKQLTNEETLNLKTEVLGRILGVIENNPEKLMGLVVMSAIIDDEGEGVELVGTTIGSSEAITTLGTALRPALDTARDEILAEALEMSNDLIKLMRHESGKCGCGKEHHDHSTATVQ